MKKKVIFALAMAAMMMTGCSNSDSSSKDRTTTTTKVTAAEQESSSEQQTTTTTAANDSSEAETITTTSAQADESSQAEESSSGNENDSSSEVEGPPVDESTIKVDNSKISSKDFGIDINYPDGWVIKEYDDAENKVSKTVASAANDDLGVTASVQLIDFNNEVENGRTITTDELKENIKQTYSELSNGADANDPMGASDITIDEGQTDKASTILLSYTQRNVRSYYYTFIYTEEGDTNRFMVFSYSYSESENSDSIKTAIEEMMD